MNPRVDTPPTEVLEALDRFSKSVASRDLDATLELFSDDVVLVGSEEGEAVRGGDELRRFFVRLFERRHTYSWEFETRTAASHRDIAWVFAEGYELMTDEAGRATRIPFRMSGVLQRIDGRWVWRMLQGSEPAAHY